MFALLNNFAQSMNDMDMSFTSNDTTTTVNSGAAAAAGLGIFMVIMIIALVAYVFFSFCLMKIFKKAGRTDSWAAFVPIYNMYVYYEIAGRPGWWAFLALIPFVGGIIAFVTNIIASMDLAKSFGKEAGYGLLLAIVPIIGLPMLAFSNATYQGPAGPEGHNNQLPPTEPTQQPPIAPQPPVDTQPPVQPTV